MSAKTELEVVATFDGLYLTPIVALGRGTELCRLADAKRLLAAARAQQHAAVSSHSLDHVEWWADAYEKEGVHAVIVDMLRTYHAMLAASTAEAAPAAQEPGEATDDLVVWRITLPSGESCHFGTEAMAKAWGRGVGKVERIELKSPPVLEMVPATPAAEQLDTSMLVAALKPFADAFEALGIQSYAGADDEFVAFLDRNEITPAHGITMRQFRQAWEVLSGKCARHHHQPR